MEKMAKIMCLTFLPWMALATMFSVIGCGTGACHLHNYVASCILDILQEHIEATAIINHCHLPLDVTFLVSYQYANTTRHSWKYTFVTANQNERVLIPGLLLPTAPHAPVFLYARVPEKDFDMHNSSFVAIEASFVAELKTDEWEEAEFLNHTIYIDTTEDCRFAKTGPDPIPWIVGGLFLVAIVSGLIGGGCYMYRKKKMEVDQLALVTSMEVGLPGAQPYQMEAVSDKTEQEKSEVDTSDSTLPENGTVRDGDSADDTHTPDDVADEGKSRSNGFGFGRLKEDHDSVVIGNPAFQDETAVPSRKTKKRKSAKRQLNLAVSQDDLKQDVQKENVIGTFPEKETPDSSLESEEGYRNQSSTDNEQPSMHDHPLEDSSDDGMPVGQGARRKVRGVSSSLTSTTSVVSPEVQETNNDSQKCL